MKRLPIKLTRDQTLLILKEVSTGSSVRMAIKIVTGRQNELYVHLIKNNFPDLYEEIQKIREETKLFNKTNRWQR